jgi:hypothetical protein
MLRRLNAQTHRGIPKRYTTSGRGKQTWLNEQRWASGHESKTGLNQPIISKQMRTHLEKAHA